MNKNQKAVGIFFVIMALTGLGLGLSDSVFANYFKDAYQTDGFQRGIIEIPRESPGIISLFIISALAFLGDVKLSIAAHILSVSSLIVLGLFTPAVGVMLVFLFINSLGMHMFMPLGDSLGLNLAGKSNNGSIGTMMGRFNGVRTAFAMIAGILVFAGFKTGFFSFTTPVKLIFLIAAVLLAGVLVLLFFIQLADRELAKPKKVKIVIKKEYRMFYLIAILFGARKQIMYVYGPWVLIELLEFKTDTMALLAIAGGAVGIFFIPAVGRWIDRYGTSRIMTVEAGCFFVIYIAYGILSAGLHNGIFIAAGITVIIAFILNMIDRMTMQFSLVRAVYMRKIAVSEDDVTPTLSLGLSLDHTFSILSAILCGWLWRSLGPQYVFVFAAFIAIANMVVARYCAKTEKIKSEEEK